MGVPFIPIYQNDFGAGVLDIPTLPGNGTATAAGGQLAVSSLVGQDLAWFAAHARDGIMPYVPAIARDDFAKLYYEFTILSWTTGDPAYSAIWASVHQDDQNFFAIFSNDGINFFVQKAVAAVWTVVGGPLAVALPARFRFVWDRRDQLVYCQCLTSTTPVIWTDIAAAQSSNLAPTKLGLTHLNAYPVYPAATSEFDDILVYADSFQQIEHDSSGFEDGGLIPQVGGKPDYNSGIGHGDLSNDHRSGFEDKGLVAPAGGPPDSMSGQPRGLFARDPSAFEDRLVFPRAGGPLDPMSGISQGFLVPDKSALEDAHRAETAVPTYADGIMDDQGRNLIGDRFVYDLQLYDTTGELWASPLDGNGFYGAGRDGKFRWDGYEAGPTLNGTSFGTLAGGLNGATWMTDREPSAIRSSISTVTMNVIADDHIRFATSGTPSSNDSKGLYSRHRWHLMGDFDIRVSFENRNVAGTGGTPSFTAAVDDRNLIYVQRMGNFYNSNVLVNNGAHPASAATTDSYGQLRLVRSSQTMSAYYWNAGWILLGTPVTSSVFREPMTVSVGVDGLAPSTTITSVDVFGFTIVSGATDNTAGWFREPSGQWRGARQDFPGRALVCASRFAVDIIDFDNNRLWMRFVARDGYAMHHAITACRRIRARNGMMLIPYDEGGDICVDFTTDDIRFHSASSSSLVGAILDAYNGSYFAPPGVSGRDVGPVGLVANRNMGDGYSGTYPNWQTPGRIAYDADLFEKDGYLYKVHATNNGMGGHKWKRWYFEGATPYNWWSPGVGKSAESSAMLWCRITANGDLFYMDSSNIYSANHATWDAKVGGSLQTWTADNTIPLPGTRSYDAQYHAEFVGADVFLPANEGVYRGTWPGPFTLVYGWADAAVPYPILGWAPRTVVSIRAVADNLLVPLLALGTQFQHDGFVWSQLVLVNPATNAIYGVAPAARVRRIQAMAAVM